MAAARLIDQHNRDMQLGLKPSQLIVITSRFSSHSVDQLHVGQQSSLQYLLTKPVDSHYLYCVLMHAIHGQELCSRSPVQQELVSADRTPAKGFSFPAKNQHERNNVQDRELGVLLIDDNNFCRHSMKRLIQNHTNKVTTCEDGLQGLRTIEAATESFDLVFVDYQMPDMDGLSLITAIRTHEHASSCPRPSTIICKGLLGSSS